MLDPHHQRIPQQRRLRTIRLLQEGHTGIETARQLGVRHRYVNHWKRTHLEHALPGLRARRRSRSHVHLKVSKAAFMEQVLAGARQHGHSTDLWTCDRLRRLLRKLGSQTQMEHLGRCLTAAGLRGSQPPESNLVFEAPRKSWAAIMEQVRSGTPLVFAGQSRPRKCWGLGARIERGTAWMNVTALGAIAIDPNTRQTMQYLRLDPEPTDPAAEQTLVGSFLSDLNEELKQPAMLLVSPADVAWRTVIAQSGLRQAFTLLALPSKAASLNPAHELWDGHNAAGCANGAVFDLTDWAQHASQRLSTLGPKPLSVYQIFSTARKRATVGSPGNASTTVFKSLEGSNA